MQELSALPSGYRRPATNGALGLHLWSEPDFSMLDSERGDVPLLPLEVFSSLWRTWIIDTAQGAGAPVDYVAMALVAAVAGIGGCGVWVKATEKWSEPLILWMAAIGKPSTGKSPALAAVRRLVRAIEAERQTGDEERLREHTQKAGFAAAVTARWQDDVKIAVKNDRLPPDKPADATPPDPFVPNQLLITDATMESVADVLRGNSLGLLLWRDELSAWLVNMGRYSGGNDQAQWLEAWPAAPLTVNRKNKPPVLVPHFAVSIVGGLQPDRLAEVLSGADDGLAVRFLFGWPDAAPHVPPSKRRAGIDDTALDRLRWIERAVGTAEDPRTITLDDDAKRWLDEFAAEHHSDAQSLDGFEAGFFGKGLGHVLRLAGVLALLEASEDGNPSPVVTGSIFQRAAGLWQGYFWPHAKAALRVGGGTPQRRLERKTLLQLRSAASPIVSREDLRRVALGGAINATQTDALMARLTTANWARMIPAPPGPGRPATRWEINPMLFVAK